MKLKIKYSQSYRTRIEKPNTTEIPKGAIYIDDWSIGYGFTDSYKAPEVRCICLYGHVTNHPKLGSCFVTTSKIIKAKGKLVYTKSGSIYFLGTIEQNYLNWLKKHNIPYDPNNPIETRE